MSASAALSKEQFDNEVAVPAVERWCRAQQGGSEPYAPYVADVWGMVRGVLEKERERSLRERLDAREEEQRIRLELESDGSPTDRWLATLGEPEKRWAEGVLREREEFLRSVQQVLAGEDPSRWLVNRSGTFAYDWYRLTRMLRRFLMAEASPVLGELARGRRSV